MSRIKWMLAAVLMALFLLVELGRYQLGPLLDTWRGRVVVDLLVFAGLYVLLAAALHRVTRQQRRLERRNRELTALHKATLDIYGQGSLGTILQRIAEAASELLEARYGAVAVLDETGDIQEFVTTGLTHEEANGLGSPPSGDGLLGVGLREGARLRIPNIDEDPRSVGFPPGHPHMKTLLAVPIECASPWRGNLYVTDRSSGVEFSPGDEESLVGFAKVAAIAIDNAYLQNRIQTLAVTKERSRIGREMHDGTAQILAYVNAKAQAVERHLQHGRTEDARGQLEQLARAAREAYTDAREGILALRTKWGPDRPLHEALEDFLDRWEYQSGIRAEVRVHGWLELDPMVEVQLVRIVQEALANARKHSGASKVLVELAREEDHLTVQVEDDGSGFDPGSLQRTDFPRFGLSIMRERAESIGGVLRVDSSPGRGTRVMIELPLDTGGS